MRRWRFGAVCALGLVCTAAQPADFTVSNPAEFQAALTTAQSNGQHDTISVLPCSGAGCAIELNSGLSAYDITAPLTYTAVATEAFSLTIDGSNSDDRILNAAFRSAILQIDTTAASGFGEIIVRGMTFLAGLAGFNVIPPLDGGAIYILGSGERIEISGSVFLSNSATDNGGAVFARLSGDAEAPVQIFDCTFDGNETLGEDGGAVHVQAPAFSSVQVFDTDFFDNTARRNGGGLFVTGTDDLNPAPILVTLSDVSFQGNFANANGGGADVAAATVQVELSGFVDNDTANGEGAGLYVRSYRQISVVNTGFAFNSAVRGGGGLATALSFDVFGITLTNNTFVDNQSLLAGGGALVRVAGSTAVAQVYNNILFDNGAPSGADIFIDNDPIPDIPVSVEFFNNAVTTLEGFPDANASFGITDSAVLTAGDNIDDAPILPGAVRPDPSPVQGAGSPTIDAGLNTAPGVPATDFEGDARPLDGTGDGIATVDIGMDESPGGVAPALADLTVSRVAEPDPVQGGQNLTYTLTVSNAGPDDATGVVLTETLDPLLTLLSADIDSGAPCTQPDNIVCSIGALAAGGNVVVTIVASTPVVDGITEVTSVASVAGNEDDPNAVNDGASSVSQVLPVGPPMADLAIAISDSPDPVFVLGGDLTYAISVDNNGPDTATSVALEAVLPDAVIFRSATASGGGACDPAPDAMGRLACNLPDLPVANNATVTVVVTPDPMVAPAPLDVTASVSAAQEDPDMTDNVATETTTVNPPSANTRVSVTTTPQTPTINEVVTFTVSAANAGPSTATQAGLTIVLPTDAAAVSVDAGTASCSAPVESVVSCALGDLADGDSVVVLVRVTAPDVATLLAFSAEVTSEVADPDTADNMVDAQVEVIDMVELIIEGEGGSGAIGMLELLLMLGALGAARVVRPRRGTGTAVLLAGVLSAAGVAMICAPAPVAARDVGWYVGAAAGGADAGYGASDLRSDLARRGWRITDPSVDDADLAWKVYGGFAFGEAFALEAGWVDLGKVSTRFGASVPPTQVNAILNDTLAIHPTLGNGATLSAVFRWELVPERFALHTKVGLFAWNADIDVEVVSGATGRVSDDDNGVDVTYGIGMEWRINPSWSLSGEWERYRLQDWTEVPSLGVRYRFGQR